MTLLFTLCFIFVLLLWTTLYHKHQALQKKEKEIKAYVEALSQYALSIRAPLLNEYRASVRRAQRRIGKPLSSKELQPLIKSLRKQRITPNGADLHRERALQLQHEYAKKKRSYKGNQT
jgi:hypothetical protein